MNTTPLNHDIYQASKTWAKFRYGATLNALLDHRLELMQQRDQQIFEAHKIQYQYEIEATDILINKLS
jgi:hypothetical protein